MNVLRRAVVIFVMAALFVPLARASAPEEKKEVQKSSITQAQLEQVEKELAAAEKAVEDYKRRVNRYMKSLPCGNEVMERANELKNARIRLKELENSKGDPAEVKAAKAEVANYEQYFHELLYPKVAEPMNMEDVVPRTMELRRKVADLAAQREVLKGKAPQVPVKKTP